MNTRPSSRSLQKSAFVACLGFLAAFGCSVVDKKNIKFDDKPFEEGSGGTSLGGDGSGGGTASGSTTGSGGTSTGGSGSGGTTSACEAATMRCDGRQVQVCAGSEWVAVGGICPNACVNGVCGGSCVPDSKECITNRLIQTCNDKGEWEEDNCPDNTACVDADNTCGGVCEPGKRDCQGGTNSGNHVRVCDDNGQWVDNPSICPQTCNAGVCVGCTNDGDTQCVNEKQFQTCNASTWGAAENCNDKACVGNACTGSCFPGNRKCADGNAYQFQTCTNQGEWGSATTCSNQACSAGNCIGVCQPGAQRCDGNAVQNCNASGQWETTTDCSKESLSCVSYKSSFFCGECASGATRCDANTNNALQVCNTKGEWSTAVGCGEREPLCYEGACRSGTEIEKICDVKGSTAKGCLDSSTIWYCSLGSVEKKECALKTPLCKGSSGTCGVETKEL